jgi:hypothetical protein
VDFDSFDSLSEYQKAEREKQKAGNRETERRSEAF